MSGTEERARGRIIVVDDHPDIRENIREYLELKGRTVSTCPDARSCTRELASGGAALVILDLGLPDMDGLEWCRALRASGDRTPVLMLTARDTVDDRVTGLVAGADDYLVKPFALRELAARVDALERRSALTLEDARTGRCGPPTGPKMPAASPGALVLGDVVLDEAAMRVTRAGRPVRVNPMGLRLLGILMRASPRVVSRMALESRVWPEGAPASDSLRSNLYLLRQALEKAFPELPPVIETHPGFGWAFTPRAPGAGEN